MRLAIVLSLVGLVLLCPSICGAADSGDHAHHQQPADSHDDAPVHCPDEGTSCVCDGAVRPADLRSDHLDGIGLHAPALLDLGLAQLPPAGPLGLSSPPSGPPALLGASSSRALLQNYRF